MILSPAESIRFAPVSLGLLIYGDKTELEGAGLEDHEEGIAESEDVFRLSQQTKEEGKNDRVSNDDAMHSPGDIDSGGIGDIGQVNEKHPIIKGKPALSPNITYE